MGTPAEAGASYSNCVGIYEVNIRQIRTQQQLLRISAEVMPNSVIVLRIYGINIRKVLGIWSLPQKLYSMECQVILFIFDQKISSEETLP